MKRTDPLVLHPLLMGLYPVAALLAHNIGQVELSDAARPTIVSLLVSLALMAGLRIVLRGWQRAGLLATVVVVLFFSYGHVYQLLRQVTVLGQVMGRHRFLVPVWSAALVASAWAIARSRRDLRRATVALNLCAALALIPPVVQIASFRLRSSGDGLGDQGSRQGTGLQLPEGMTPPDVYYIILDGYTRGDVLQRVFGYDNSPFLDALEEMGFCVPEASRGNYAQTDLSLGSSLNLNYLESLGVSFDVESADRTSLESLLVRSQVRSDLEGLGYTVVAFGSGYRWTEWQDANVYLEPPHEQPFFGGVSSFESLLIQTSGGLALTDAASLLPDFLRPDLRHPLETHRERLLFVLDQLESVAAIPGPKLVFAHLIAPHTPFVFDVDGEPAFAQEPPPGAGLRFEYTLEAYAAGYTNEITYLNGRILHIIANILAQSVTDPVIIIQADHGADPVSMQDRMAILNAYHLPGDGERSLYTTVTPVNSFRIVFNEYFGGSYGLLEDNSYFSMYNTPFDFTLLTEGSSP